MLYFAAISCDRYIAVVYPFVYQSQVTTTRCCLVLLIISIYSILFTLIMTVDNVYQPSLPCEFYFIYSSIWISMICVHISIFLLGTAILNGRIIAIAAKHRRSIAAQEGSTQQSQQLMSNAKSIKTFSLVGGIYFFLFYLPFIIVGNYAAKDPWEAYTDTRFRRVQVIVAIGLVINSAINPAIYALSYAPIKKAFRLLFCPRRVRTDETSS